MSKSIRNIKAKISALRKAFDDLSGDVEQLDQPEPSAPRQRRNKKEDRKMDMALNFEKYNRK